MLWLILVAAAGLSIPPVMFFAGEFTDPVPEVNPLFIFLVALLLILVVWAPVALCIWVPRTFVRVPILLLMLVPYVIWIQRLSDQGFFLLLIHPDIATGEGYFDAKPDRDLAAALVACRVYDDPPKCDFPKIDALARAANVNAIGRRDKTFMDLAIDAGAFPEVVGSLLRAGEAAGGARDKAMHYACEQADPKLARAVLAAGVDPNLREAGGTPYMIRAVAMPDGLAAFLDAGADANAETPEGHTALMEAVRSDNFESVALLLAHGAREDRVGQDGTTLEKLMADVPPDMLKNLPPDVDAFVKRHQPR
jgi:hypothetical protein